MLDGIYKAASGMEAYGKNHQVIATNIANANTVGFKRNFIDFKTVLTEGNGVKESTSLQANESIDFSKGSLEYTGNSLDIAIKGEGFFTIQTDQGLRHTRNGQFQLSNSGEIVTSSGGSLLGEGGPLQIPKGSTEISIDNTGVVKAGNKAIGQLLISNFKQLFVLVPTGAGLFKAPLSAVPDTKDVNFKIAQGYLEKPNVDVIMEMVNMIANMRKAEASGRIIRSFSDTIESLINSLINV